MSHIQTKPSWHGECEENKYNVVKDPLAVIYNENQWRLGKISPLYNLQYNKLKFKQYASKIQQSLISNVTANSFTKYVVEIVEQPFLKYTRDDSHGLMITVSVSQENNSKIAYVAILLSWGVSSKIENATHLPYLLERGENKLAYIVKTTLQKLFDCNIKLFSFTQNQLLQFGFNFVENDTSRNTDPFILSYQTPQVDHKNKLKFTFDIGDIHIIWNGVKEEEYEKSELVNVAYQVLQRQIFHMLHIQVTELDLFEVNIPKAEIKSNGVVRMRTPEVVNSVFTVLNEMCKEDIIS